MFATMKIHYNDGTELEVHGRTADVIAYERKFHQPATSVLSTGTMFTEHLWFFAWIAEAREREVIPFDDWIETVLGVEVIFADEVKDPPTEPVATSPAS